MMLGYCLNAISSKAQHKVVITQALILAKKKGEVGTALRPGLFQWFGSFWLLWLKDLVPNKKKNWVMY